MNLMTFDIAWLRSSSFTGCSEITQSPEGNRARGCLPKSMTTSINFPISGCRNKPFLIFKGSNSRNNSSSESCSDRDVGAALDETVDNPLSGAERSRGLRISGDRIDGTGEVADEIALRRRRVRRNAAEK